MSSAAEASRNTPPTPTSHALLLGTSVDAYAESLEEFVEPTGASSPEECFSDWLLACSAQGARPEAMAARERLFTALSTISDEAFAQLLSKEVANGLPKSPWHPCVPTVMLWQCVSRAPHLRAAIALLIEICRETVNTSVNTTHFYLGQPQISVGPDEVLLDDNGTLLEVAIAQGVATDTVLDLLTLGCVLAPDRRCNPASFALTVGQFVLAEQLIAVELQSTGGWWFSTQALLDARRRCKAGFGGFRNIGTDEGLALLAELEKALLQKTLPHLTPATGSSPRL